MSSQNKGMEIPNAIEDIVLTDESCKVEARTEFRFARVLTK